jgi:peptidoglycan hydrolase-like protein with peptidoglycan-binding domain
VPNVQPLFSDTDRASAPAPDGLPVLSGRTKRFAAIVRRVQIALLAQDFYHGPINGVVGPALRSALRGFQTKRGLESTGTITPSTLDALMVSSQ